MPRPPGRPREDPERLSPRQAEWLDAARRHLDRTGEPPSRIELIVAMGCVSKGGTAYVLGVLERKGYLVRVRTRRAACGSCRRIGPGGRPTVVEMLGRIRRVDDATLEVLREAIEARRRERDEMSGI